MKKFTLAAAALAAVFFTGCASTEPVGSIYTRVSLPVAVTAESGNVDSLKVGKSECKSILSLVATGDASVAAAAKNGNIKRIHFVDWKAKNILGIIGEYECTVYGD